VMTDMKAVAKMQSCVYVEVGESGFQSKAILESVYP
jgi:hypothetical protein